ncbi:2-nitropropane dioxygenase [Bacillus sp. FJAT-18017]|uniref:NAD(P)H-dependent flavin oxidoreductase n=1 Tax=Bacillus sp. FJAT-18017 TaxID=1705566 RepID=UPI0006AED294|nr:nitronate monooxygenase [Bacillus sp. FJAT-18017]ALC90389.1 2-nitropropane dioxygenase [Bacillus sp. FJAT-18017]
MNRLTKLLNIRYPIIQGGMGNISNAPLAAAISEAGGLGTIGAGTMDSKEVEQLILETKSKTNRPFAINVPIGVSLFTNEILSLAIKHKVQVVSLSAGNPAPFIPKLHEAGIKVIAVTASVKHARKAEEAGVDAIVGEGYEAAGINSPSETTTMALIPQLAEAVRVPVIAAGGIADGRGLAAALVLGASAIQMGTRFITVKEAPFNAIYKKMILDADDTSTLILGRQHGRIRRVLDAPYARKLLDQEPALTIAEFMEKTSEYYHKTGAIDGNVQEGFLNAGQIAGQIKDIPSVSDLFKKMLEDSNKALKYSAKQLNF